MKWDEEHVLQTPGDEHEALLVLTANISRAKPADTLLVDKEVLGVVHAVVALEYRRTGDANLTLASNLGQKSLSA